MKDRISGRDIIVQKIINLFPKSLRLRFNPDRYAIENFIIDISKKIKENSKVLDAGAGPCPYKKFFKHCKYEACDISDISAELDFICSLDNIPVKDNYYDVVLSTEVLEHVEEPEKVVKEFYRVLKKGGKLFLSVPQGRTTHQEPYNFFYFTKYGIKSLLEKAGFRKFKITPKGGYFWFLADAIRFNGIVEQRKGSFVYYPLFLITYSFTNILIPFVLFHLDFLDREKKWTCGYLVEAEK